MTDTKILNWLIDYADLVVVTIRLPGREGKYDGWVNSGCYDLPRGDERRKAVRAAIAAQIRALDDGA